MVRITVQIIFGLLSVSLGVLGLPALTDEPTNPTASVPLATSPTEITLAAGPTATGILDFPVSAIEAATVVDVPVTDADYVVLDKRASAVSYMSCVAFPYRPDPPKADEQPPTAATLPNLVQQNSTSYSGEELACRS